MRRAWYRRYLPGWIVTGGGGSGGAATVQTDGVTLQGDGSSGNKIRILQVETQNRLTGAGTVASPLDVAGWPLTAWNQSYYLNNSAHTTANTLVLYGMVLPAPITFSKITVFVQTADNVNNNDVGIYNSAGTLVANAGAQHIPSNVQTTFTMLQGSQTILPGQYFFAFTSVGSTLALFDNDVGMGLYFNASFGTSTGGALPSTITPPALSPSRANPQYILT